MEINFSEFKTLDIMVRGEAEMHLTKKYVTFTGALLEEMGNPEYVKLLINPKTKLFALQKCDKNEPRAFCFLPSGNRKRAKYSGAKVLRETIVSLMGDAYEQNCSYGWKGNYLAQHKAWVFDITKAYDRYPNR